MHIGLQQIIRQFSLPSETRRKGESAKFGKWRSHRTNPTDTYHQFTKIKINEGLDFDDRKQKNHIHANKLPYYQKKKWFLQINYLSKITWYQFPIALVRRPNHMVTRQSWHVEICGPEWNNDLWCTKP